MNWLHKTCKSKRGKKTEKGLGKLAAKTSPRGKLEREAIEHTS
jgi:hypothetical protein